VCSFHVILFRMMVILSRLGETLDRQNYCEIGASVHTYPRLLFSPGTRGAKIGPPRWPIVAGERPRIGGHQQCSFPISAVCTAPVAARPATPLSMGRANHSLTSPANLDLCSGSNPRPGDPTSKADESVKRDQPIV
jgi:hypothetical protein